MPVVIVKAAPGGAASGRALPGGATPAGCPADVTVVQALRRLGYSREEARSRLEEALRGLRDAGSPVPGEAELLRRALTSGRGGAARGERLG